MSRGSMGLEQACLGFYVNSSCLKINASHAFPSPFPKVLEIMISTQAQFPRYGSPKYIRSDLDTLPYSLFLGPLNGEPAMRGAA